MKTFKVFVEWTDETYSVYTVEGEDKEDALETFVDYIFSLRDQIVSYTFVPVLESIEIEVENAIEIA